MLLFATITLAIFASPPAEKAEPGQVKVVLAAEGDFPIYPEGPMYFADLIIPEFEAQTGAKVFVVNVNSPNDTTERLDMLISADRMPNVYWAYGGRAGIYASAPDKTLPLNDYIDQETIDKFYPSYIEMFSRDGNLYGLPCTSWATVGSVNGDILDRANGRGILDDGILTYDELAEVTRKLRADGSEYYASGLFAAETGGDYYLYTFWLAGHGAVLYNTDGSIGLNSPEGIEALTLMKDWYDEGLLPFGAAGLKDTDYTGQYIASDNTVAISHTPSDGATWNFVPIIMQGVRKLSVDKSPVASGIQVVVAFNTGTNAEKAAAAELVKLISSAKYQQIRVDAGRFPSRFDVDTSNIAECYQIGIQNMADNGVFNMGLGTRHYVAMRFLWQTMIQSILTNDTVEWAKDLGFYNDGTIAGTLAVFEDRGNELIAEMAR